MHHLFCCDELQLWRRWQRCTKGLSLPPLSLTHTRHTQFAVKILEKKRLAKDDDITRAQREMKVLSLLSYVACSTLLLLVPMVLGPCMGFCTRAGYYRCLFCGRYCN